MGAGLLAPLLREPVMEFCRLRDCGIESWRGIVPRERSGATPEAMVPVIPPTALRLPVVAVILRVLVLEDER